MFFSIRIKLAIAFLLTTALAVAGMFLFVQWSFDRGFLEYLNTRQQEKLGSLNQALANTYQEQGGWQRFRDLREWGGYLHQHLANDIQGGLLTRPPGPPSHLLQRRAIRQRGGPPLPQSSDTGLGPRPGFMALPADGAWGIGPPGSAPGFIRPPTLPLVIALFDAKGVLITGHNGDDFNKLQRQEIRLAGEVIGFLAISAPQKITEQLDLVFAEQQTQSLLLISLAMVVLPLIIAVPLGLHLVQPIRKLNRGTRVLTEGQYDTRLEVNSRDELEQLSHNFNRLAQTLEANEQARKRWVADISHELRTPLAVLKGHIEALQDGVRQASPKTLGVLATKVVQLTRLVDDLYELALSDLGALSYHKENSKIAEILEDTVLGFTAAFDNKGLSLQLQLQLDDDQQLFCDTERLSQLLSNLCKNSLRYSDSGGGLVVKAFLQEQALHIQFDDTTPTVSSDDLPQLFDSLYRAESSRDRALGGAGLGLAICKNIVVAHGGMIHAKPSTLGGLSIHIMLPLDS